MSTEPDDGSTITIVHEGERYRGTRRAPVPRWRRYPAGATFIVALLVLITSVVVLRTVMGAGDPPQKRQIDGWQPPTRVDPSPDVSGTGLPALPADPSASTSTDRQRSPVPNRTTTTTTAPATGGTTQTSPSPSSIPSPSPSPSPSWVGAQIVGIGGKCVEAGTDAIQVYIDDCGSTDRQRWARVGNTVRAAGGKCLDVRNGSRDNGATVWLYACNGTGAQVWEIRADRTWRNPQSGRCLTTVNGSSGDGTRLMIWTCTGGSYQRWTM